MEYPSKRVEKNKHGMKSKEEIIKELVPPHLLDFERELKLAEIIKTEISSQQFVGFKTYC